MDNPDQTTHFGFRDVPLIDKQTLVNDVFHSVARRYDLMNDLMSAGLHRVWKDLMINALNPPRGETPFALLDVAGGTGDIAFRAAEAAGPGFRATVCDINSDMLGVGRTRALARHLEHQVSFVEGNAESLAFPDRSFDAYTIAFGIRNVPQIDLALKQAYRVLRPGSRILCLAFSTVDVPGLDRLYELLSVRIIPPPAPAVTGDAARRGRRRHGARSGKFAGPPGAVLAGRGRSCHRAVAGKAYIAGLCELWSVRGCGLDRAGAPRRGASQWQTSSGRSQGAASPRRLAVPP